MSDGDLKSGVVIGIVAASTFVLLASLGLFAHCRPKHAAVRWFDRSVPLIQIASFVVMLATIVVVVVTGADGVPQTVVPCCFIVWVLLYLFAALRGGVGGLGKEHATDRNGDIVVVAHSSGVPDTQQTHHHGHHHHGDTGGDGGGGGD
ncbi:hypothetical protein Gpo141_00005684 [Globisporangium polare]